MNAFQSVIAIAAATAIWGTTARAEGKETAAERKKREFLHQPVFQNNRNEARRAATGARPPRDAAPVQPSEGRRPDSEDEAPRAPAAASTTPAPSMVPKAPAPATSPRPPEVAATPEPSPEPEAAGGKPNNRIISFVVLMVTFAIFLWTRRRSRR